MKKIAFILGNDMHMDIEKANEFMCKIHNNLSYKIVTDYLEADIIIFYGCAFGVNRINSIRMIADIYVHASKSAEIILTGCLAKTDGEELKQLHRLTVMEWDLVLKRFSAGKYSGKAIIPQNTVIISEGCLKKCTYCQYGKICTEYKSKPYKKIYDEVKALAETEYIIYITGAHETSDYGTDFKEKGDITDLMNNLAKSFPDVVFYIGWFHPSGISNNFIKCIKENTNIKGIMVHMQHASNEILMKMGRPKFEFFESKIKKLKKARTDLFISTEVIVGFPGETQEQYKLLTEKIDELFKNDLIDDIAVASFDAVENTVAQSLENQVDVELKCKRAELIVQKYDAEFYPSVDVLYEECVDCSALEIFSESVPIIYNYPTKIFNDNQRFQNVAGIDTIEKFAGSIKFRCKDILDDIIETRSEFEIERKSAELKATFSKEYLAIIYECISKSDGIKDGIKKRAKKILL